MRIRRGLNLVSLDKYADQEKWIWIREQLDEMYSTST